MQFKVKTPAAKSSVATKAVKPSLAAYATICDCAEAAVNADANAPACEALEVEHSFLTLANAKTAKEALGLLSASEQTELAGALGASVESLGAMKMEDFAKKCIAALPVEPATEGAGIAGALIIYFAVYFAIVWALVKSGAQLEKMELKAMWRQLEVAFKGKEKDALDQIVVNGWGFKETDKALKAGEAILQFMKQDVKKIFGDGYKLADIEKLASNLWTCSLGWSEGENKRWWSNWKDEAPKKQTGSLRDLGYNEQTIVSCSERCGELCAALMKFPELQKEAAKALKEHKDETKLGFFAKIKRWWTETKEQKKQREQDELILTNKFYAINQLLWGFRYTIIACARSLYQAAVKADVLVKKSAK